MFHNIENPFNRLYFAIQGLQYHNEDNPSKTTKMMRILMFVRILSLIRLARVSRLVRFFNEVEKVSSIPDGLQAEIQSASLPPADILPDRAPVTEPTSTVHKVTCKRRRRRNKRVVYCFI